jgi:hypothetical protein
MKLDKKLVLEYGGMQIETLKSGSVMPAVDGPSRQAVILQLLGATHEQVMREFSRLMLGADTPPH